MSHFWFWISGAHNASWAILWGGIISCASFLSAIPLAYRKLNCHSKGCWRIGHHDYDVNGVKYKLCQKCHPEIDHKNKLRREHFARHHKENNV